MSEQPQPAPTSSAVGSCPTTIPKSRTPQQWKFTQHLRTTRPPRAAAVHDTSLNDWLVGCFRSNGPLRQYFSLYRAVYQREGEREKIEESKNVQTTPTRTYCKRNRPLPYYHPYCRTPRHWKFTQDHRTTRPSPRQTILCLQ